jgi:hypothetical protein
VGQNASCLDRAGGKGCNGAGGSGDAAAGDAGAVDELVVVVGEDGTLQSGGTGVGHQGDATASGQELGGEGLGGEEVAAGAAGGDDDEVAGLGGMGARGAREGLLRGDPITLTLDASRLDLSRSRGRG